MPGNWSRCGDKIQRRRRQRRHVQRLTNVAHGIGAALMLVQEHPAGREKEQYCAAKQRHRAVRASPPRYRRP
jgi:hypothetical protein